MKLPLLLTSHLGSLSNFGKNFNILSALFAHQPLALPQKIDSREGWF